MLWFGLPERTGRRHLGDYRAGPKARRLDVGDGFARDPLLIVVDVEDRGSVAGADVVALAILGRRVVDLEKEFEQGAVIRLGGVVSDLDRLGVSGVVPVGRVLVLAAGVADPGRFHTWQQTDEVLDAPEAATRQNRRRGGHRLGSVS